MSAGYILRDAVLDKGFVELIDIMPGEIPEGAESRDIVIVNAARVSYSGESKGVESDRALLRYLWKHKHTSPFEQVIFKFRIKAPILVWWQMDRHRTLKYSRQNRQSGRYTEYEAEEYYIPCGWRLQDSENKQGSGSGFVENFSVLDGASVTEVYERCFLECLSWYKQALEDGIAREQARLFLPAFALYHTTVLNVDAWNLTHFLRLRTDEKAQWEIQQYAYAMEAQFALMLPWVYACYRQWEE